MTIINCGSRRKLIVDSVFEGVAGVARGRVSFTPNRIGRPPALARGGLLDGEPIMLSDVKLDDDGRTVTARFELLA